MDSALVRQRPMPELACHTNIAYNSGVMCCRGGDDRGVFPPADPVDGNIDRMRCGGVHRQYDGNRVGHHCLA